MERNPNVVKAGFSTRSSFFGLKINRIQSAAAIRHRVAAVNASNAKRSAERQQIATQQILAFYKPSWLGLTVAERSSKTAIARALHRKGIVTVLGSETSILPLLERLHKLRKIKLPLRPIFGRARKKRIN